VTSAVAAACFVLGLQSFAQHEKPQIKPTNPEGQRIFAVNCAGCHGLDGKGGERAPSIVQREVQRLSDADLINIVQEGIPGAGMPAFHSLASADVKAVIAHLRILQGATTTAALPGNPVHGKTIFYGQAGCSGCHMVAGNGGFIASDLSGYGGAHSVPEIRTAITRPNQTEQARSVLVVTRAGQQYAGRIRNQDNFSLQLQSLDGTFHFFPKSDIERMEPSSQTLMPSDYSSTLSPGDLNDLVSFLINSAKTSAIKVAGKVDE
jgi:cytochrome c oxidase cbb3-type subunit III